MLGACSKCGNPLDLLDPCLECAVEDFRQKTGIWAICIKDKSDLNRIQVAIKAANVRWRSKEGRK